MNADVRKSQELMGLPVLTVAEGKHLGPISRLLVRPETRSVEAVGIGGGAFSHPSYLRFSQLSSIGDDAVMVASEAWYYGPPATLCRILWHNTELGRNAPGVIGLARRGR